MSVKQVIVVRKDLNMRKGKLAAQVAHAAMQFIVSNNGTLRGMELLVKLAPNEAEWLNDGRHTKIVVSVDSEYALQDLIARAKSFGIEVHQVIDAGLTEFHGVPTLTCAAFGPDNNEVLNSLLGHLKLL